jgi:predicted nucleotide-binding protein
VPSRSTPSQPKPADITPEKMRIAIPRLEMRIAELRAFDPETVSDRYEARIGALERAIDEVLVGIFGPDTVDYRRYNSAKRLDRAGHFVGYTPPLVDIHDGFRRGKADSISILEGIITRFKEDLELAPPEPHPGRQPARIGAECRKVFVVHGHEDGPREAVARFLERIDFEPIILHEQANRGRTVIEKVEAHGDVGFAVVLLTPDDEGCLKGEKPQPRPRQNVLLELGYFAGRLGRANVCALKVGDMELPSDFGGVVWEKFDGTAGGWKSALARELKAAGFKIDASKVVGL